MQFREDDCRLCTRHGPAVMGILRQVVLNMMRTVQQNCSSDGSIGLLRNKIGRPLDSDHCPDRDFTFALEKGYN